ncbi:unnamed protein product, partial [marine sediment metagenome]
KTVPKIAQNLAFELGWSRVYGIYVQGAVSDTMLKHVQLDADASGTHGLDSLCRAYFPEIGVYWDGIFRDRDGNHTYNCCQIEGKKLFKYNAYDAIAAAKVDKALDKALDKVYDYDWRATHAYFMEVVCPLLARLHFNGWSVNKKRGKLIEGKLSKVMDTELEALHDTTEVQELLKQVNKIAWKKERKAIKQLKTEKGREARKARWQPLTTINPNSVDQRAMLLYDIMGLDVTYTSDAGNPSVKKDHIELMFQGKDNYPPAIVHLLRYLEAGKLKGTYVTKCTHTIRSRRGFVHPTYKNET